MLLFYASDIQTDIITLDENDSKHAIKVLRLGIGDKLHVVDGVGHLYDCEILDAHPKKCTLTVLKKHYQVNPFAHISLAVAPTKNNNRYEWFLEKVTEIGVGTIIPIITKNSERRVVKRERMEKVLIAAMKQSLKRYLPDLKNTQTIKELIADYKNEKINLLIAHCYEDHPKEKLRKHIDVNKPTLLLIGPEGDFSPDEVEFALSNGFQSVTLGDTRLRTETAAIVACTQLNMIYD
tara:strand:- start:1784 stop:2491 length:708 start_codon:yes stop_codon:yes gene_type:complete